MPTINLNLLNKYFDKTIKQAPQEDRGLREQEEATKHDWRPVYVGVYSTTHRCLKCKLFNTVSINIPASACPEYGCEPKLVDLTDTGEKTNDK